MFYIGHVFLFFILDFIYHSLTADISFIEFLYVSVYLITINNSYLPYLLLFTFVNPLLHLLE